MKLEFYRQILLKNPQISDLIKMRPVVDDSLNAERHTDITNIIAAFSYFAKATKTVLQYTSILQFAFRVCSCLNTEKNCVKIVTSDGTSPPFNFGCNFFECCKF